jgi:hypothetical protein
LYFTSRDDRRETTDLTESRARVIAQAFSLVADGNAQWINEVVPALLGRRTRSFARFVTDTGARLA